MTQTTHTSWQIKDAAVLHELLALMEISAADAVLLSQLQPIAAEMTPKLTDDFYRRLTAHQQTLEYIDSAALPKMHATLAQWFLDLFGGTYDETYAHKRLVIGQVHVKIGLPVRYPLAMLDVVAHYGEQVARRSPQPEQALGAFRRILALDVAIFNQAYEDNQLRHLAELVGGERLARLLLMGMA